jgi:hypothetical protein
MFDESELFGEMFTYDDHELSESSMCLICYEDVSGWDKRMSRLYCHHLVCMRCILRIDKSCCRYCLQTYPIPIRLMNRSILSIWESLILFLDSSRLVMSVMYPYLEDFVNVSIE